jgi:hypothetical protein
MLVLVAPAAVREVPRRDDQLRLGPLDESAQNPFDLPILACTRMQIGYMEEAYRHDRMRL